MPTQSMTTLDQLNTHLATDCVVVVAVIQSALCNQAVTYLQSFLPESVNIVTVNIYDHPEFQRSHRVTVVPTGYVYQHNQIVHEFKMPFNQDQILCWIK